MDKIFPEWWTALENNVPKKNMCLFQYKEIVLKSFDILICEHIDIRSVHALKSHNVATFSKSNWLD